MAIVHRFSLPDEVKSGRDIFIAGVGLFTGGYLDVPTTSSTLISLLQATPNVSDLGQVDTATQPGAGQVITGDPFPQYMTAAEFVTSVSGGTDTVASVLKAAYDAGSKPWLQAVAGAFGFSFTTLTTVDTATGLPTAAAVQWPDGTTGTFTGTTDGVNGYTGYTVTWAGGTTKTVTASGITYDATTGIALGPTTLAVA